MSTSISKFLYDSVQRMRGWNYLPWAEKLDELQWAPPEKVEEYRWTRLRALLEHCNSKVPFYRDEFRRLGLTPADLSSREGLKRLPQINKTSLRTDYPRFFASDDSGKVEKWTSSGSSGEPFPFRRSKEAVARDTFAAWSRGRRWWGVDFGVREVMILSGGRSVGGQLSTRLAAIKRLISWRMKNIKLIDVYHQDANSVRKSYHELLAFKPKFMRTMASGLYRFCATVDELGLDGRKLGVQVASITGETLLRSQRDLIERVLGCKTIIEYGCTELGIIAFECPSGGLHLSHENHIYEFEHDGREAKPGERADLIVTSLNEWSTPMVRYAIGDIVVPTDASCPCGRTMPLILGIQGRAHDDILTPAGQVVHATWFTHIFDSMPSVHQFRVVQEDIHSLRIEIRGKGEITSRDKEFVLAAGQQAMGDSVKIEVVEVREMPVLASGKHSWIVSKVRPKPGAERR